MTASRVLILNCDDTVEMRYGKTRVLRAAGYEVVECGTGAEALRKVRELMPDLVLCDVRLPDMSGLDVCRRIKQDAVTGTIPVIQISATFVTKDHQKEGLKHGADIYLTEPLEPKELETVVSVLLRLARTEAGLREALARERAARAQAEEATQLKDEFLATLSHELRTPMNIIIGWAHLLRTGPLDEPQKQRATEAIERAARSQAQLIEDLLDVSRIVTGKFRLVLQDVEIGRILQIAIDSLRPVAQSKQLAITLEQEGGDARVSGDPDRLQQVFWNLLSNAVKFTAAGGRVDVRMRTVEENVSISVTDTGVGIQPEFLPFVFERFRQADSTSTRQHSGMGLGLAIVRHVIDLHGGSVHADSAGEERGATFTVMLPRVQAQAALKQVSVVPAAGGASLPRPVIKVLLVEDDPDAREVTAAGLTKAGFEVHVVSGAVKALELLEIWLPDVVVSDIGMPGMDGHEFIRLLRARPPERGGTIAALALTAFAGLEDAARARSSGYQAHLPKPISPDALANAIVNLTRRGD
ncbi:MAG: sensor hybrid histidine kinase [Gammaproteobacteria bacterium]|nr:sensor hybrid histidine kinase [Gammaproteobacteria bacterium]